MAVTGPRPTAVPAKAIPTPPSLVAIAVAPPPSTAPGKALEAKVFTLAASLKTLHHATPSFLEWQGRGACDPRPLDCGFRRNDETACSCPNAGMAGADPGYSKAEGRMPLGLSISSGTHSERLVLGAYCIILISSSSMTCVSRWAASRPAFGAIFFAMISWTAVPILPVILLWDGKPGHRQP